MYVGGVISKHRKLFSNKHAENDERNKLVLLSGFIGCIRNFRVNGVPENLLTASRDLIPCAYAREIAYVHNGGFATFG